LVFEFLQVQKFHPKNFLSKNKSGRGVQKYHFIFFSQWRIFSIWNMKKKSRFFFCSRNLEKRNSSHWKTQSMISAFCWCGLVIFICQKKLYFFNQFIWSSKKKKIEFFFNLWINQNIFEFATKKIIFWFPKKKMGPRTNACFPGGFQIRNYSTSEKPLLHDNGGQNS